MEKTDLLIQLALLLGALKALAPKDNDRIANLISCTEDMMYAGLEQSEKLNAAKD